MLEVQESAYGKKEKGKINFGWKLALQIKPHKAEGHILSNGTQNDQLNEHCGVFFIIILHECGTWCTNSIL